jgi:hypothetical protein
MKKKTARPQRFKTPISDSLDQRAENNVSIFFRWIVSICVVGFGYAVYDMILMKQPTREFLIGLPIGALFLSVAILSHFDVQYRTKMICSILITFLFIFISFMIGTYFGVRWSRYIG